MQLRRSKQDKARCGFARARTQKYVTEQNTNRNTVLRSLYATYLYNFDTPVAIAASATAFATASCARLS